MTTTEINQIKEAVLDELRANAKTINQLTLTSAVTDTDMIELNGGRRANMSALKSYFTPDSGTVSSDVLRRVVFLNSISEPTRMSTAIYPAAEPAIGYNPTLQLLYAYNPAQTSGITGYARWSDYAEYGTVVNNGVMPDKGRLYIDIAQRRLYHWDGNTMADITPKSGGSGSSGGVTLFDGVVSGVTVATSGSNLPMVKILFDTDRKEFIGTTETISSTKTTYYEIWAGKEEEYMTLNPDTIYIDRVNKQIYYSDGITLILATSSGGSSSSCSCDTSLQNNLRTLYNSFPRYVSRATVITLQTHTTPLTWTGGQVTAIIPVDGGAGTVVRTLTADDIQESSVLNMNGYICRVGRKSDDEILIEGVVDGECMVATFSDGQLSSFHGGWITVSLGLADHSDYTPAKFVAWLSGQSIDKMARLNYNDIRKYKGVKIYEDGYEWRIPFAYISDDGLSIEGGDLLAWGNRYSVSFEQGEITIKHKDTI